MISGHWHLIAGSSTAAHVFVEPSLTACGAALAIGLALTVRDLGVAELCEECKAAIREEAARTPAVERSVEACSCAACAGSSVQRAAKGVAP